MNTEMKTISATLFLLVLQVSSGQRDEGRGVGELLPPLQPESGSLCRARLNEARFLFEADIYFPSPLPRCDAEGNFDRVQCVPQYGICWCADPLSGREIVGTHVRGFPNCTEDMVVNASRGSRDEMMVCPEGEILNECNLLELFVAQQFECLLPGRPIQPVMNPCGESCTVLFYSSGNQRISESMCQEGMESLRQQDVLSECAWEARPQVERILRDALHDPVLSSCIVRVLIDIVGDFTFLPPEFDLQSVMPHIMASCLQPLPQGELPLMPGGMPPLGGGVPSRSGEVPPSVPSDDDTPLAANGPLFGAETSCVQNQIQNCLEAIETNITEYMQVTEQACSDLEDYLVCLVGVYEACGVPEGEAGVAGGLLDDPSIVSARLTCFGMTDRYSEIVSNCTTEQRECLNGLMIQLRPDSNSSREICPNLPSFTSCLEEPGWSGECRTGLEQEVLPLLEAMCARMEACGDGQDMTQCGESIVNDLLTRGNCDGLSLDDYPCWTNAARCTPIGLAQEEFESMLTLQCNLLQSYGRVQIIGPYVPQCSRNSQENRGYNTTQCHGALCWCVDEQGRPLPESLSRGDPGCDYNRNGVMSQNRVVCLNGARPQVCRTQCRDVTCPGNNDDVTCRADVCNNCRVTFYGWDGLQVNCAGSVPERSTTTNAPWETTTTGAPWETTTTRAAWETTTTGAPVETTTNAPWETTTTNAPWETTTTRAPWETTTTTAPGETTTTTSIDACTLPSVVGRCRAAIPRWYFNTYTSLCETFYFGGCGGNENNFETQEECENRCSASVPQESTTTSSAPRESTTTSAPQETTTTVAVQESTTTSVDVCVLPSVIGRCRAAIPRWFYNTETSMCEMFNYGGCGGNGNNFETEEECNNRCQVHVPSESTTTSAPQKTTTTVAEQESTTTSVDVCVLPSETGRCRAAIPRWFYNTDTSMCEMFNFGGCGGNGNNFETQEECENKCKSADKVIVISGTVKLNANFSLVRDNVDEFKKSFAVDVAQKLNVMPNQIKVIRVREGSIVVDFEVLNATDETVSRLNDFRSQVNSGQTFVDVRGSPVPAVVNNITVFEFGFQQRESNTSEPDSTDLDREKPDSTDRDRDEEEKDDYDSEGRFRVAAICTGCAIGGLVIIGIIYCCWAKKNQEKKRMRRNLETNLKNKDSVIWFVNPDTHKTPM